MILSLRIQSCTGIVLMGLSPTYSNECMWHVPGVTQKCNRFDREQQIELRLNLSVINLNNSQWLA